MRVCNFSCPSNNNIEILSSISENIDLVIVGQNPGSKLKKAQELKLKTISETEWQNLLK